MRDTANPKGGELIANRHRAGSKEQAEEHFESGMAEFMAEVAKTNPLISPATIFYAYRATETKDGDIRTTGWDTFSPSCSRRRAAGERHVANAHGARKPICWRRRATRWRRRSCSCVRPRPVSASLATRGEFIAALRGERARGSASPSVRQHVAPVDMAQSTIGPGMKVFSRYAKVVEADGSAMSVSCCARDHQRRVGRDPRRGGS